ncbi:hypothetical protein [Streptomyces avermitilis]|uniref:hypothetical protein n=1 Tax=Streptomyces avermitilis TaxID=33903 RepID=UPI00382A2CBE
MKIKQDNRHTVFANIQQDGDRISGNANHSGVQSIEITGTVRNEAVDFFITWANGAKGHYTGDLKKGHFTGPMEGILTGFTEDVNNPGHTAQWEVEDRVFTRLSPVF